MIKCSEKESVDILQLFKEEKAKDSYVSICAPMVRYSKLPFRNLVRKYGVQLCFTPMIVSESFCSSQEARLKEFSTDKNDSPVIAQFAARNSVELLIASELIYPYADGIDVNCGCPQRWAIKSGYGCGLLKKPELIKDMLLTLKRNFNEPFTTSIKLRILEKNIKSTINLCQQLEKCGASFLTVHARRPWQKSSEAPDILAISEINKSLQIPLIYNGNIKTINDANDIYSKTNCNGIMAARGLLTNPALFSTKFYNNFINNDNDNDQFDITNNLKKKSLLQIYKTPFECINDWINIAKQSDEKISFPCFQHHLLFMMGKHMKRKERFQLSNYSRKDDIFGFLETNFNLKCNKITTATNDKYSMNENTDNVGGGDDYYYCNNYFDKIDDEIVCKYDENLYKKHFNEFQEIYRQLEDADKCDSVLSPGKFFKQFISDNSSNQDELCFNNDGTSSSLGLLDNDDDLNINGLSLFDD